MGQTADTCSVSRTEVNTNAAFIVSCDTVIFEQTSRAEKLTFLGARASNKAVFKVYLIL